MGNICSSGFPSEKHEKGTTGNLAPQSAAGAETVSVKDSQGKGQKLKLLGRGTAADTWLFRDTNLKTPVAIKLFTRPLRDYPVEAVQREVLTQTDLGPGHINLVNVYELFLTDECLGLVMECAEGGSLTSFIEQKFGSTSEHGLVLKEDDALYLFKQFISAVSYCHRHNLAHRDLKLDNTLLDGSNPPVVKICDFGFAKHFASPLEKTKSHLGTPEYMSPELLHKTATGENDYYDARSSDIWASGIMLLVCLCGAFPFDNGDQRTKDEENAICYCFSKIAQPSSGLRIKTCQGTHTLSFQDGMFPPDCSSDKVKGMQEVSTGWQDSRFLQRNVSALSSEVKDLLNQILVIDPAQRITVEGVMKHSWYNRKLSAKYQSALDDLDRKQAELERHVAKQNYDAGKIAERSTAIKNMIEEAGVPVGQKKSRDETAVKAFQQFSMQNLQTIDLTEKVIVGGETPSRGSYGGPEDPVVRERFNRASVGRAVQTAFSGDSHKNGLHDAVVSRTSH